MNDPARGERGWSLTVALLLVVAVGTVSKVAFDRLRVTRHEGAAEQARIVQIHAATSAVEWARHRLANDPTWPGGDCAVSGVPTHAHVTRHADHWTLVVDAPHPPARPLRITCRLVPEPSGPPEVVTWTESSGGR